MNGFDEWVDPEAVADVMGGLVSSEEIEVDTYGSERVFDGHEESKRGKKKKKAKVEGGIVVEVARGRRVVAPFMDPGPLLNMGPKLGSMVDEQERLLRSLERGEMGEGEV